jgi:hypothetical protein
MGRPGTARRPSLSRLQTRYLHFVDGLGWDETDARLNFGVYDVIIVLDFGLEPIEDLDVLEFFDFTETEAEIVPATLEHFRARVAETLQE